MTLAGKKLSFEEYLALSDTGLEGPAELIDGELVLLPPEAGFNLDIATFLQITLIKLGIPFQLIHAGRCEVQTPVLEPGDASNRFPDLIVLWPDHIPLTRNRMTITLEMLPPRWVMEVVSPGKTNHSRDYIRKRNQYAAVGIPEYMIVDPEEQVVRVLRLAGETYQEVGCYRGEAIAHSPEFPELSLTTAQILSAGA